MEQHQQAAGGQGTLVATAMGAEFQCPEGFPPTAASYAPQPAPTLAAMVATTYALGNPEDAQLVQIFISQAEESIRLAAGEMQPLQCWGCQNFTLTVFTCGRNVRAKESHDAEWRRVNT